LLLRLHSRAAAQSELAGLGQQALTGSVFANTSKDNLSELCNHIGPRVTGSKVYEEALQWALARFRALELKMSLGIVHHSEWIGAWVGTEQNISANSAAAILEGVSWGRILHRAAGVTGEFTRGGRPFP